VQGVDDVAEVLAVEGLIQAQHLLELGLLTGVALLAHHQRDDVAGEQPDDGKDQQGDQGQRRQQQHQPAKKVAGHDRGAFSVRCLSGTGRQAFLPSSQISSYRWSYALMGTV
jgi:hypothetical protein